MMEALKYQLMGLSVRGSGFSSTYVLGACLSDCCCPQSCSSSWEASQPIAVVLANIYINLIQARVIRAKRLFIENRRLYKNGL